MMQKAHHYHYEPHGVQFVFYNDEILVELIESLGIISLWKFLEYKTFL
jgi:hypothetical protein